MDFSGKSTIVRELHKSLGNRSIIRSKFISNDLGPIFSELIELRKTTGTYERDFNVWLDTALVMHAHDMSAFAKETLPKDAVILQDVFLPFKNLARGLQTLGAQNPKVRQLKKIVNACPEMESYYITADLNERIKRAKTRSVLTNQDKFLLDDPNGFDEREKIYRDCVLARFPKTKIVDTTNKTIAEVGEWIKSNMNAN
jgi:thymidylate kinase